MPAVEATVDGIEPPASTLGRSGWVIVGTLVLATVLANIASVCLFPQIVTLSQEFGRPVNQVVWTMAGFHVIAAGVGGVAAALGAIVGNRRMLAITLVLLLIGSLMAALSNSLSLLIAARVVQGVSMAIQALSIGIIANTWRGEPMRRAMSMIVFAMGSGAVIAYLLSGIIWKSGGTWRTLFWLLAGATVLDLVLTVGFIKETQRRKDVRIDYAGCAGLVGWTVLLLLPLSQANSWGWGSAKLLGLLLPGALVLVLWVVWELRTREPLVELRLLSRSGVWQGGIVWLALAIGLLIPAVTLPYLFQTPVASGFGFGRSMFVVALALGTPGIVMCFLSPVAAPIMRRLGPRRTMLLGALFGLNAFGMAFAHGSLWLTFLWMALNGVPAALAGSGSYALAAEAVAPEQGILVSTIYNIAAGTGCTIASAVAGYVLTLRQVAVPVSTPGGVQNQPFPANATITWAALIAAGMAVAGIVAVFSIRTGRLRADRARDPQPLLMPSD